MSRERLHGKVRWKSLQDEHVQRYRVSFPDSFKGIKMCCIFTVWFSHQKLCLRPHWSQRKSRNLIVSPSGKSSCGVVARQKSRPRRGDWFSAIAVCHYASFTAGSIGTLISQFLATYNMKEKRKPQCVMGLTGKSKWKAVLQAARDTSGENKGSVRFRQTLQTGSLPGVLQPNVFKCILLITKL